MNFFYESLKRLLDIVCSVVAMVILCPVWLLIALLIKMDSKGPIFHKRKVVGIGTKEFNAYKFRTMVNKADELLTNDPNLRAQFSNNFKLENDPRITKIGILLRKTSLDEVPQFFNVLVGQMSLVGPRMIVFEELDKYGDHGNKRVQVKPGLTGLWQVSGRSRLSYKERIKLDMYYIDHQSLKLDFKILFKTIPAVIKGDGAV